MICDVTDCINNADGYCEIENYIRIDEYGKCDSIEVRLMKETED